MRRREASRGGKKSALGSSSKAKEKFGAQAVRAGARGEKRFLDMVRYTLTTKAFRENVWTSLDGDPAFLRKPGRRVKRYRSDVDVAIASGTNIVLIDVKAYKEGGHWWNPPGSTQVWRNAKPYKSRGKRVTMSQSMDMARNNYQEALRRMGIKGKVYAMVVMVPSGNVKNAKNPTDLYPGQLPDSTFFLRWPGGIKTYNHIAGMKKIVSLLGGTEPVDPKVAQFLNKVPFKERRK